MSVRTQSLVSKLQLQLQRTLVLVFAEGGCHLQIYPCTCTAD